MSSVFILPKQIIKDVDAIFRRFIWSSTNIKKYRAKVAWEEVCCPKVKGGMDIKCILVWNKACMLRHL